MKFDATKAKHEYVTTNISYRALAEKYEVSYVRVATIAKNEQWVKERKKHKSEVYQKLNEKSIQDDVDKLKDLRSAADRSISCALKKIEEFEESGVQTCELKQFASALKDLVFVQRDLNGLLSEKDKLNIRTEEMEQNETGVVVLPGLIPDTDIAVSEGEI